MRVPQHAKHATGEVASAALPCVGSRSSERPHQADPTKPTPQTSSRRPLPPHPPTHPCPPHLRRTLTCILLHGQALQTNRVLFVRVRLRVLPPRLRLLHVARLLSLLIRRVPVPAVAPLACR